MPPPTPFRRIDMLDRLESEEFDVLVIGGGITGTGVALDAASRGGERPSDTEMDELVQRREMSPFFVA